MVPEQLPSALMQAGSAWEYPEPASGEALPVTKSGQFVFATGASGETNTLASPTGSGITLDLFCRSHGGGDRVVTIASAANQTGNNTLTFGATSDYCRLVSIRSAANTYRWRIVANDGVALSTV